MTTRNDVVSAARSYLGAKFRHQGRSKASGIDCVGLVICVAHDLQLSDFDISNYSRMPHPPMMRAHLVEQLDQVGYKDVLPGDILWFRVIKEPQHLGIVSAIEPYMTMVHAYSKQPIHACVEQPLGDWRNMIDGCFRFRGIS